MNDDVDGTDEVLVTALAAGKPAAEAAVVAGLSLRTVRRRLSEAGFKKRLEECRAAMVDAAAGRLVDGIPEASQTLRLLLKHADPHVQCRAAGKLIELALKVNQCAELERRVEALEDRAARAAPGHRRAGLVLESTIVPSDPPQVGNASDGRPLPNKT